MIQLLLLQPYIELTLGVHTRCADSFKCLDVKPSPLHCRLCHPSRFVQASCAATFASCVEPSRGGSRRQSTKRQSLAARLQPSRPSKALHTPGI